MKKLLSLAAALALTAAVLSCSMVAGPRQRSLWLAGGRTHSCRRFSRYAYSRPRYDFLHRAQLLSRL